MKSPEELRRQLIRNWENSVFRETTLLDASSHWPIALMIGCPTSQQYQSELRQLSSLIESVNSFFHTLLIRRRILWRDRDLAEVVQATRVALKLMPGIARGLPLRTLAVEGIDTKFFERNRGLVTAQ